MITRRSLFAGAAAVAVAPAASASQLITLRYKVFVGGAGVSHGTISSGTVGGLLAMIDAMHEGYRDYDDHFIEVT